MEGKEQGPPGRSLNRDYQEYKELTMDLRELSADDLHRSCDPDSLPFDTTADLSDLSEPVGQPRAVEAIGFGIDIEQDGYNLYALGEAGTGRSALVRQLLEGRAAREEVPWDLCYVNNFDEPRRPCKLQVPPGKGKMLAEDMKHLLEEGTGAVRTAFENEDYQNRQQSLVQEVKEKQQEAFEKLQKQADEHNLTMLRTPAGIVFAPTRDGEVMPPDEFAKLSEEERKRTEQQSQELQQETHRIFRNLPKWEREIREKLRKLDHEVVQYAVGPILEEMRKKYEDLSEVVEYLRAVEKDFVENVPELLGAPGAQPQAAPALQRSDPTGSLPAPAESFMGRRYQVNVVVDHGESKGAPVVYEANPTYQNLFGRVEHQAHMGALVTDFNMIRAGALHHANGGYLILDAVKVLTQPFAWEGLKRMLRAKEIKIESLGQAYSLISTVSVEPEPVPLDVKVALLGPPMLYYLLREHDPEFGKLFKVAVDFDTQMDRNDGNQEVYAKLIATVARKEGLRHFDKGAVARVIEWSARTAGDNEKLSIHMQRVTDLLREAHYWARRNGNQTVSAMDVQKAVDAGIHRSDRLRERIQEQINRGKILIDTEGQKVGQVNGLSVLQLGDFMFGRPSRITARVRLGKGEVVDIEREVEMGGPIHSKGVLILGGFLGARYASERPLSLSASLVFEQSYGGIDGDSASSAELYALLSAASEIPIRQSLAVTGSVNQHGQIQPIGGVNHKIEGFFDVCNARGLTGDQGVLIPSTNLSNLMLRENVIEAVRNGRFHIYPVENVDQGIELLTGVPAGEPDREGKYPADSVNGKVQARLAYLAEKRAEFSRHMGERGDS